MNAKMPLAAALLTGLALWAPAQAAAPEKRACFHASNVNGFRASDDRTVYLRVGVRDVYRLDLMSPCADVNWSERIGIVHRGSPWICSGLDAEIVAPSPIGPHACPVQTLRKLTPAELAALPKKDRP